MSNQAAWIPSKGAAIEIGHAEMPIPGPGELVIEVPYTSLHFTNLYSPHPCPAFEVLSAMQFTPQTEPRNPSAPRRLEASERDHPHPNDLPRDSRQ